MKKIVLLLTMMLLATPAFAAGKYASVDVDKILNGYSKTQSLNANFQKQEADIRVYMLDAQKKVVSAKTDAERKTLEDKYGKELQTKMEAIQKAKLEALKGLEVDVKAAIQEAIYALDTLGADGIKLATNSRGQYVGDVELDTLMHILNERQAVIILHPHKPSPVNEGIIANSPLAVYEYPAETTRAVINMISRNVLSRYSDVKFVVPHCGSFLPLAIPRMKAVHPAMVSKGFMQEIDWEANLRNLYYDLAGAATPEVVRTLLAITTPDHLLYGSDYPYQPDWVLKAGLERMRVWMSEDPSLVSLLSRILYGNAVTLFVDKSW